MSNLSKTILQAEWGVGQVANFPYPDRSTSADFASSGHTVVVASMGFSLQDVNVSLGATMISVTNNSSRSVPRGEEVYLSLAEADDLPVGGQGAGLSQDQIASGADAVVGTNDQNELIGKDGGKEFKASIIPRNMTLNSLLSLVNGGGEIASSSDTRHIVKLEGEPGSGKVRVFSPDPHHLYTYQSNLFSAKVVGDMGISTYGARHSFLFYENPTGIGGDAQYDWANLSAQQKDAYANDSLVSIGVSQGLVITPNTGNFFVASKGQIKFTLKTKVTEWTGDNWANKASYDPAATAEFNISNSDGQDIFKVLAKNPNNDYENEVYIGIPADSLVGIGSETGKLKFFTTDYEQLVPKQSAATLTAAGSRVGTTGNAVTDQATFTGGIGTTAYTIPQIVQALKKYGLLVE